MIVVGIDFAPGSRAALAHARALASACGLPVHALHVREFGERGEWEPDSEALKWLTTVGLDSSEVLTRTGVPWVELVRYAREQKALLIVAGRHGNAGPQVSFLGSTASRLANQAPDPVLLVTGGHESRSRVNHREER